MNICLWLFGGVCLTYAMYTLITGGWAMVVSKMNEEKTKEHFDL